ncbi:MAG: undecaprenyl-diphosphate phosphatase [Blautia sp.]|nr:undecaprenyl-diphosphate phosphatase [Blautia sp.]
MGIIQGLTEFLPVSSFAHLIIAEKSMGIGRMSGVMLESILHLGSAIAVLFVFRKDFLKIMRELLGLIIDLIGNLHIYLHNRRSQERDLPYTKLADGTWRRLTVLLIFSSVPTAAIGYCARRLVTIAAVSRFMPGACMLITGVVLLVTDLGLSQERRMVHDANPDNAVWMGICQGLSVFPGISRAGMAICAGLLGGLSHRFVVKYACLMSVPAILGAFALEITTVSSPNLTPPLMRMYAAGAFVAFLTGCVMCKILLRLTQQVRLRIFAMYNFLAGALLLLISFQ